MKITKISVRAGRTIPHPLHSYGNIRCDLEYVADLEAGEDAEQCRRQLQATAESDIEQHAAELKNGVADFAEVARARTRVADLEKQIESLSGELTDKKKEITDRPLFHRLESSKQDCDRDPDFDPDPPLDRPSGLPY